MVRERENKIKTKKTPRGVTVRENKKTSTIYIRFQYKGITCREALKGLPVTKSNINYAERKLHEIINNIERNNFNYADYFPESKKLKIFGSATNLSTILSYLDKYIVQCEKRGLSPSTIIGYKKYKNALKDLHNIYITDLTPAILKNWAEQQKTSLKTIRNRYSFLMSSIDEAVIDGLISYNPVRNLSISRYHNKNINKTYVVEPFTPDEISTILSNCQNDQIKNLFQFSFETGMRPSEICAAKWKNVDFDNKTYYVDQAKVVKIEKTTKTKSGTREIKLSEKAMLSLLSQKNHTFNISDYIFHDPKAKREWASSDDIRKKAWMPTIKKAGIRYRNPYQMRHTFATRHISEGVNLFWLAGQMGHKGTEMIQRHYGSYLKEYDGKTIK